MPATVPHNFTQYYTTATCHIFAHLHTPSYIVTYFYNYSILFLFIHHYNMFSLIKTNCKHVLPFSSPPPSPYVLSHVWLFATPWTVAHQTPWSMGFPRQECWSGLPFPPASHLQILLLLLIICLFYHRHRGLSKSSFSVHGLCKVLLHSILKVSWWLSGKESACQCRRHEFNPCVEDFRRRKWKCTPVFLPGKSHGPRSPGGYSSWGWQRAGHDLAT